MTSTDSSDDSIMRIPSFRLLIQSCAIAMSLVTPALSARAQSAAAGSKCAAARAKAVRSALDALRNDGHADDGTSSAQSGSGLTSLLVTAALRNGVPVDHPIVAKKMKAIEAAVKPEGGIYS